MELNNEINSTLLNTKVYFRIKKIVIDENRKNICELAKKALEAKGIKSSIELDENNKYMIKITQPIEKLWKGE